MKRFVLFLLLGAALSSVAQKQEISLQQAVLGQWREFRPQTLNGFSWRPGTMEYSYIRQDSMAIVDAKKPASVSFFVLNDLNSILKDANLDEVKWINPKWATKDLLQVNTPSAIAFVDYNTRKVVSKFKVEENAENESFNADNSLMAYTVENNLYVADNNGNVTAVTTDTNKGIVNGQSVHRNEFGIDGGIFWSPNGKLLAFYSMDESMVTDYPLVDITTRIATAVNIKYPMAGMKSHEVKVKIFNPSNKSIVELKTGEPKEQYLTNVQWNAKGDKVYIAVLNREQNHMKFNCYDATSGDLLSTLFEETDEQYVEPLNPPIFLVDNSGRFIWQSRRDGWNHLYLYDESGKLISQLTKGNWEVTKVNSVDSQKGVVYFTATKENPLDRDLYSVSVKKGVVTRLTKGLGTHYSIVSPDYKYFMDFYSTISIPNEVKLYSTKGKVVNELINAKNPYADYNVSLPKLLTLKANDGTELYGRIITPTNFDSTKKYPVIVYVYGGPHSQLVTNSWMGGCRLWECYFANQGYIMFTLDNRGTSNRGADFEQIVHRQLGTQEIADQLVGVDYLKSLSYIDTTRMGVHGWSFGGFMTISLMLRTPDIFKVGVAGGPVTDWKYYEVMYGERYMDTPQENPDGYKTADLKQYVTNLKGKLLMIQDDMDKTVMPQNSLTLIHEFVKNGVQVDFFMYPQHDHNVIGKDRVHLIDKILRYFNDYL